MVSPKYPVAFSSTSSSPVEISISESRGPSLIGVIACATFVPGLVYFGQYVAAFVVLAVLLFIDQKSRVVLTTRGNAIRVWHERGPWVSPWRGREDLVLYPPDVRFDSEGESSHEGESIEELDGRLVEEAYVQEEDLEASLWLRLTDGRITHLLNRRQSSVLEHEATQLNRWLAWARERTQGSGAPAGEPPPN